MKLLPTVQQKIVSETLTNSSQEKKIIMGCKMVLPDIVDDKLSQLPGMADTKGGPIKRVPIDLVVANPALRRKNVQDNLAKFHQSEKVLKREELGRFKDIQKRRILAEVINVFTNPTGEPFVLILDDLGKDLLSSQLDMSEIMYPEGPVCMVEKLGVVRQPLPDMEAVYFCEPTAKSLTSIIGDFAQKDHNGKPRADWGPGDPLFVEGQVGARSPDTQYKGVHLLFAGGMNNIGRITRCAELRRHLITCSVTRVSIFPLESQFINFSQLAQVQDKKGVHDYPNLNKMYGRGKESWWEEKETVNFFDDIADKLLGVCVSLHENPYVRMMVDEKNVKMSSHIVKKFIEKMKKHMAEQGGHSGDSGESKSGGVADDSWYYHQKDGSGKSNTCLPDRATMLVFDRREDLSTPLVHDFGYQSLAMDLLSDQIAEGKRQTSFTYEVTEKNQVTQMHFNNEEDQIWTLNRHKHISQLGDALRDWKTEFHASEEYQLLMKQKNGQLTRSDEQMKVLRTSEETGRLSEMISRHFSIAQSLIDLATETCDDDEGPLMFAISELEQQMITGVSVKRRTVSTISDDKIRSNLMNQLGRLEVDMVNKKRLLLLWFINFGWKYSAASHDKVIASCEPALGEDGKKLCVYLAGYVVIPKHNVGIEKSEKKIWNSMRSSTQKRAKERENTNDLSTRLHEPKLIEIVRSHIEMELSKTEYPWHGPVIWDMETKKLTLPEAKNPEPEWYTKREGTASRGKSRRGGGSKNTKHRIGKSLGKSIGKFNKGGEVSAVSAIAAAKVVDDVNVPGFKFEGARFIVCVFGGVTYPELRGLYDLMQEKRCEIIICATDILTPSHFLRSLRGMSGPSDDSDSDEEGDVSPSDISVR